MSNPWPQISQNISGINSISAGMRRVVIPSALNIQHWYDVTDESTVWEDEAATIGISDGGTALRIDDKGYAGDNLLASFIPSPVPLIWRTDQINGLAAVDTDSDPTLTGLFGQVTVPGGVLGFSIAAIGYRSGAPRSSVFFGFGDLGPRAIFEDTSGIFGIPPNFGYTDLDRFIIIDSGIAPTSFLWSYILFTHAANGDYTLEINGSTALQGNATYVPVATPGIIGIGGITEGKQTEGIIWDISLGPNGRAQFRNYLNKKYGGLPRV